METESRVTAGPQKLQRSMGTELHCWNSKIPAIDSMETESPGTAGTQKLHRPTRWRQSQGTTGTQKLQRSTRWRLSLRALPELRNFSHPQLMKKSHGTIKLPGGKHTPTDVRKTQSSFRHRGLHLNSVTDSTHRTAPELMIPHQRMVSDASRFNTSPVNLPSGKAASEVAAGL